VIRLATNRPVGKGSFTFARQDSGMRRILLLCVLGLASCGVDQNLAAVVGGAAVIGSVTTFGKSPPDIVYSAATGKDCSVVRLDQGKSYCRPIEPKPQAPPFCTRSLGVPDCWQDPPVVLEERYHGLADGPSTLTAEQEANRTRRWPWTW
jgi:hypothetical protein